ncbi:MAG: sensor histidine kinase [Acutalibacteraceae bacterium]
MKLFLKYLKQHILGITAGILFCLIFIISFYLYHLPLEAVIYPSALCLIIGLMIMLYDFSKVRKKHDILRCIKSLTDIISDSISFDRTVDDTDYQRIISLIVQEQTDFRSKMNIKYSEMVDYYTVWVHQIKTPIASMRLNLQNEDSELSRKLSSDLFRIEQYVDMVLTFLRLDSESTDYVIKEYDLDSIVRQAVRKFAGDFITCKLSLNYEPLNVMVLTDEKWLMFVIEQIISNALKYTSSGGISITLESPKTLCIRDTGIGIAPEDLPRIFEKGYTGYNGRTDKKASGIGLYLCKRICSNLKHGISAESTVDVGTVIKLDLSRRKIEFE